MIERLTSEQVITALPRGAPVILLMGAPTGASTLNGVLIEWSGKRDCRIDLAPSKASPQLMRGSLLEVVSPRLDGVYRVAGMVTSIDREDVPGWQAATHTLALEVDFGTAGRVQQRQFFRLRGGWRATITAAGEDGTGHGDGNLKPGVPVLIWNLSAGGMLIEDPERRLARGDLFAVAIDLKDGGEPLNLQAEVVRREERSPAELPQWGCRFIDLDLEDESRIIHHLQEKIRARFAIKSRPQRDSSAESA
jgi:hypothetical protein